ncbi:hypothetical protein ACLOJK_007959, partial [Asimina triloba]
IHTVPCTTGAPIQCSITDIRDGSHGCRSARVSSNGKGRQRGRRYGRRGGDGLRRRHIDSSECAGFLPPRSKSGNPQKTHQNPASVRDRRLHLPRLQRAAARDDGSGRHSQAREGGSSWGRRAAHDEFLMAAGYDDGGRTRQRRAVATPAASLPKPTFTTAAASSTGDERADDQASCFKTHHLSSKFVRATRKTSMADHQQARFGIMGQTVAHQ